jgi:tetratricopeptide (TPR) repeat protein
MTISKAALVAALIVGAAPLVPTSPAEAQVLDSLRNRQSRRNQQQQQQQQASACRVGAEGERQFQMSATECTALEPLLNGVRTSDWTAARAAIPAAQAAAQGADAKYLVGQAMLHIGIGANDQQLQSQAVDALIASGGAQASEMPALYEHQLRFATAAGDTAKADRARAQLEALNPNDPTRFARQADARVQARDFAGAVPLYLQAIQAVQPVPPALRRNLAAAAFQARDPNALRYFREWLTADPNPNSWHDTLAISAEGANTGMKLDIYRLMRGAGAMLAERDFVDYAEAANEARAFEEVVAVLQDGLSRNLITNNVAWARERMGQANGLIGRLRQVYAQDRRDALSGNDPQRAFLVGERHYGAGEYAQAAEMYRAALQKGGDANVANLRIGAALAMAGQRAEAETALRAVTGPRAELAQLWLLWLSRRA